MKLSTMTQALLLIVLAVYVISPADLMPGPLDDLLAVAVFAAARIRAHNS